MVVPPKSETNLADAVNQKARRRRRTLFKKASEYSSECGADIHIVLRMKKSGKIFILTSNSKGWPLSDSQIVSLSSLSIGRYGDNNSIRRFLIIPHQSIRLWIAQRRSRETTGSSTSVTTALVFPRTRRLPLKPPVDQLATLMAAKGIFPLYLYE